MTLCANSHEIIQSEIERLREKYGDFPVEKFEVENDPEYFEEAVEMLEGGWLGDAGAWVTSQENVLLIRHVNETDKWGIPGGGHETEIDKNLEDTARREVEEETGVNCELTDVFKARKKKIYLENNPDKSVYMLSALFDADLDRAIEKRDIENIELDIGDEEIIDAEWFSSDELPDVVGFLEEKAEKFSTE